MNQKAFHRMFLEVFPLIPPLVTAALFTTCDLSLPTGSGEEGRWVREQDFLCIAALLLHGAPEPKLHLAWRLTQTLVSHPPTHPPSPPLLPLPDLYRLLAAIHGRDSPTLRPTLLLLYSHNLSNPPPLDFPTFASHLLSHPPTHAAVLGWMEDLFTQLLTTHPPTSLLHLELQYNPERRLQLIADTYQVSGWVGGWVDG